MLYLLVHRVTSRLNRSVGRGGGEGIGVTSNNWAEVVESIRPVLKEINCQKS
jgi:hypothetical protein